MTARHLRSIAGDLGLVLDSFHTLALDDDFAAFATGDIAVAALPIPANYYDDMAARLGLDCRHQGPGAGLVLSRGPSGGYIAGIMDRVMTLAAVSWSGYRCADLSGYPGSTLRESAQGNLVRNAA